ncbi:MAG: hypothetical protein JRF32_09320 [Deltaproteobacteria bacterium]|nr:hypothetical protein [Deltaproteobacteria bacterium]MBW2297792.1 hypothetical protein [Deltaproteobacteria bacterium]MBW2612298.1 hypothetical protein [Deltaproteobacteria bacterium]
MEKILGVYVSSDHNLNQLIKLCRSAKKKGVKVKLFFTHLGTRLCTDSRLIELEGLADIALCKVGLEDNKIDISEAKIDKKGFSSQSWHAEMIYACDRYITF